MDPSWYWLTSNWWQRRIITYNNSNILILQEMVIPFILGLGESPWDPGLLRCFEVCPGGLPKGPGANGSGLGCAVLAGQRQSCPGGADTQRYLSWSLVDGGSSTRSQRVSYWFPIKTVPLHGVFSKKWLVYYSKWFKQDDFGGTPIF